MFKLPPKMVKLSENFRLSDFMGCHSVYLMGHTNDSDALTGRHLQEGKALCQTLLEPLMERFGPISVSYGYISPDLSRKIVKYQDPDKPSYHRWDAGAAADVVFHQQVADDVAPILVAHEIDRDFGYSRMITYAESPFICLATRKQEALDERYRKAFYENRYEGVRCAKPRFITKSKAPEAREREYQELLQDGLPCDWKGAGYSTYHCGGLRQLHDRRVSKYSILTDFLYNEVAVREGIPNAPALTWVVRRVFEAAGALYDTMVSGLAVPRLSIVDGYASPRVRAFTGDSATWAPDRFQFTVALPAGRTVQNVIDVAGDVVVADDGEFVTVAGRVGV